MAAILRNLTHIKLLNQLGEYLDGAAPSPEHFPDLARKLTSLFNMYTTSLWLVDVGHHLLVRECLVPVDVTTHKAMAEADRELTESCLDAEPLSLTRFDIPTGPNDHDDQVLHAVSLKIRHQERLLGILNLYTSKPDHWCLGTRPSDEQPEILRAVGGQLAVFIRNMTLESNSLFYQEVHHRVKNNLQTVASLLRMQLRRLEQVGAERALEESINRIQSISLVHETLAKDSVGMVEIGSLLRRICAMHSPEVKGNKRISIDLLEPLALASREATAMALVISELVQNAVRHTLPRSGTSISVVVARKNEHIVCEVKDNGEGLPESFELTHNKGLGLTIVQTLVSGELHGDFTLTADGKGTCARISFPLAPVGEAIAMS